MNEKYCGFLFHCYQPPWQERRVFEDAPESGGMPPIDLYDKFFDLLLRCPKPIFTVNIGFSLIELLKNFGYDHVLEKLRKAAKQHKAEFTGSGAYHPILPLLPEGEAKRQIALNEAGLKKFLGLARPNGFYSPELVFMPPMAGLLTKHNYCWLVTDDEHWQTTHGGSVPYDFIPSMDGLGIFLQSRFWHKYITDTRTGCDANQFLGELESGLQNWFGDRRGYVVIAADAETFGHHIAGYFQFLENLAGLSRGQTGSVKFATLSEIFSAFPKRAANVPPSGWAMNGYDIQTQNWFPLWKDKGNRFHELMWQILAEVWKYAEGTNGETRLLADKINNSCQFWWISREHWDPGIAFMTAPFVVNFFKRRLGSLPKKVEFLFGELEKETGRRIQR